MTGLVMAITFIVVSGVLFSDDIRIPTSETETVKDLPQTESDTAETVLPL